MLFKDKAAQKGATQAFFDKVVEVAKRLDIPANDLMAVIDLETAGTFSPSITNALGYTGLIQFGKAAAERVGTTQAKLKQMTAVEQMEYVYKYLVIYKSKINSYVDLYLAIFFPAAMGKDRNYVLKTSRLSAERVAKWNPLFDTNKDKQITVGEVEDKLISRIPNAYKDLLKKKTPVTQSQVTKQPTQCPCCLQSL